jgi:replication-associated recombination protein RarA
MTTIIGQNKLLNIIDSYTTKYDLPKTMLFVGPSGCGKHTIVKYIAEKFELAVVEIDENVSVSDLEAYMFSTIDTMYLINLNKFSEKQQNQFLKFIEEPSKSVYVSLIANSEVGVLDTVLNRCVKHCFEQYTKSQIEHIIHTSIDDTAFNMFKTPGKLLRLTDVAFKTTVDLANSVLHDLSTIPYSSALVISTKLNYKDLYNKVDFDLFFDAVEYLALEDYKTTASFNSFIVFKITNQFKQYATQQNFLREPLMLNYLTTLWETLQNDA